jgi:hypothetical protein
MGPICEDIVSVFTLTESTKPCLRQSHCLRAGRPKYVFQRSARANIFFESSCGGVCFNQSALAIFIVHASTLAAGSTISSSLSIHHASNNQPCTPRATPSPMDTPMDTPCCMRSVAPCAPPAQAASMQHAVELPPPHGLRLEGAPAARFAAASSAAALASAASAAVTSIRSAACSSTSSWLALLKNLKSFCWRLSRCGPGAEKGPRPGGAERPTFWAAAIRGGLRYFISIRVLNKSSGFRSAPVPKQLIRREGNVILRYGPGSFGDSR